MNYIIALLALPVVIKLFTHFGLQKLNKIPRTVLTAEMVIDKMNREKIRPLKVELLYNEVYQQFHDKFKERELNRRQIVAIRKYLAQHVEQYEHKKFKNDIHAIYVLLSARDIKKRHLEMVQKIMA